MRTTKIDYYLKTLNNVLTKESQCRLLLTIERDMNI